MKLVDFYYNIATGEYPENNDNYHKTELLFDYLSESGLSIEEIICSLLRFPNKEILTVDDLPDDLWNDSLLKRNTFYYHKELQIMSPSPTWDEYYPFYLEMKIKYTAEDALDYFAKTFNVNTEWINKEKEIGSINFLLKNYKKYDFIEPVDFLLHLIDYVKSLDCKVTSIYDLRNYENECAEYLQLDTENAKACKKDMIVWRMDVCGM